MFNPLLSDPRPWIFSSSELTAGLRSFSGDPTLVITGLAETTMPQRRPAIGRIRGVRASCEGISGQKSFTLVIKEPLGTTRTGMAGAGLREVSFYRNLAEQLPVQTPRLLAAHPNGDWLALNLLPGGRNPDKWTADDYLLATDQLIALHDRFWGLGDDLVAYAWLARPLDTDFEIHVQAAATGIQRLARRLPPNLLNADTDLMALLDKIIAHADDIRARLRPLPTTLLHGDYFPGNIYLYPDSNPMIFDWQQAAIGPGILDLFYFVQSSRWWFDPLPLATEDLVARYRSRLAEASGNKWDDAEWAVLWDYALMWTFLAGWMDLLEAIPDSLLQTRHKELQTLWLEPLKAAAARQLIGGDLR